MAPSLSYHSVSMAAPVIVPFVEEPEREERVIRGKKMEASPPVDFHAFNPLFSDFGVPRQNPPKKTLSHEPSKPLTSLELLTNYWSSMVKKPKAGKLPEEPQGEFKVPSRKLSTEEVVRVAGARYAQFPDQSDNYFSILTHPFGSAFSGLSEEDKKEIELVQFLLAAAEKVGDGQIDRASRLLSYCELLASKRASPAQRVVLYFAEALRERIHRPETGWVDLKNGYVWEGAKRSEKDGNSEIKQGLGTSLASLTCHRQLPFTQVTQFTGLQSIIEHTSSARRIHIIDFEIRSGIQWIVLMKAFAERAKSNESVDESNRHQSIELLRITAVVSSRDFRDKVEETGIRLAEVAESMNLPFAFNSILIPNMEGVQKNMFRREHGETVVVYAAMVLRTMISRPDRLDGLMRAMRGLSPAVMVVTEVEANHNSPSFMGRFVEALFFYSAYFDCLEECMSEAENRHYRRLTEETLGEGIRNMVGEKEGRERTARSVKIEVWRSFFGRFGMVEAGLSESSLYQASLVAKSRSSCSLELTGKGLLVGWKGTPILSLSAWNFR